MTAKNKRLLFLYHLLAALLFGTMLSRQIELFNYFYGNHLTDWALLLAILLLSFVIALKYIKPATTVTTVFQLLFLVVALYGAELVYWLYSYIDWVSLITYALFIISSIALATLIKKHDFPLWPSLTLITISSATALWMGFTFPPEWLVASCLLLYLANEALARQWKSLALWSLSAIALLLISTSTPHGVQIFDSQKKYYDKVVFSRQTPFQQIDITTWKGHQWFYYNRINQFSSIDHWLYFEPMVHPAMALAPAHQKVLVIGGENGLLVNEVLKHQGVEQIDLIPIDTALYRLASKLQWFYDLNEQALENEKVKTKTTDPFRHLNTNPQEYDLIFIDVPDPLDLELNQYYTLEFYKLCSSALKQNGFMVTQAGSPYLATLAFHTIDHTIKAAGFSTLPLHNQVLTLGEWGWIIGAKAMEQTELEKKAKNRTFEHIETQWLSQEAMQMIMSFGKLPVEVDSFSINTLKKPLVHEYYSSGTWIF